MSELRTLAKDKFVAATVENTAVWSDTPPTKEGVSQEATKSAWDKEILEIVRCVFQSTLRKSDPLRLAVLKVMTNYGFSFAQQDMLYELVTEVPDFGAAYTEYVMAGLSKVNKAKSYLAGKRRIKCNKCDGPCWFEARLWPAACPDCGQKAAGWSQDSKGSMISLKSQKFFGA